MSFKTSSKTAIILDWGPVVSPFTINIKNDLWFLLVKQTFEKQLKRLL